MVHCEVIIKYHNSDTITSILFGGRDTNVGQIEFLTGYYLPHNLNDVFSGSVYHSGS
mgnify:CR=1 FL=1